MCELYTYIDRGFGNVSPQRNITNFIYKLTFFKKKLNFNESIMIQRIQSIYLLIILIISVLSYYLFPSFDFLTKIIYSDKIILKIYFSLVGSISLMSIFLFKKRKVQIILNKLNMMLNLIFLISISCLILYFQIGNEKLLWLITQIISLFLLYISNKRIKKDEELIKSIDRLR